MDQRGGPSGRHLVAGRETLILSIRSEGQLVSKMNGEFVRPIQHNPLTPQILLSSNPRQRDVSYHALDVV